MEFIEELMYRRQPFGRVLRMLCLLSTLCGGIRKYPHYRHELLQVLLPPPCPLLPLKYPFPSNKRLKLWATGSRCQVRGYECVGTSAWVRVRVCNVCRLCGKTRGVYTHVDDTHVYTLVYHTRVGCAVTHGVYTHVNDTRCVYTLVTIHV